jgi:hypothetical protein
MDEINESGEVFHKLVSCNTSLGTFPKLQKVTISFVMSVHPHGTTHFPLDGFA